MNSTGVLGAHKVQDRMASVMAAFTG
jgi:hypothetical protein